jgi:hypothetical protein
MPPPVVIPSEAEARALLEARLQPQVSPALTPDEVDGLLARAQVADAAGVLPGAPGYTPTWGEAAVASAISEGFAMKAAKAINSYDVKAGDVEAKRSQTIQFLADAGAHYAQAAANGGFGVSSGSRGIGTITTTTAIYEAAPLPESA